MDEATMENLGNMTTEQRSHAFLRNLLDQVKAGDILSVQEGISNGPDGGVYDRKAIINETTKRVVYVEIKSKKETN